MQDENLSIETTAEKKMQEILGDDPAIPNVIIPNEGTKEDAKEKITEDQEYNGEITGEALLNMEVEEEPFLVEQLFQKSGLSCLAGSSDTGKSSLLRQLSISIVTGKTEFIGFGIYPKHKSVIYVSTEDMAKDTQSLLRKQVSNVESSDIKNLRFIFDSDNLLSRLDHNIEKNPTDLVILDCFSDVFDHDLKDTHHLRSFLKPYQKLAVKYDCLFIFLHHTGKRTENLQPSKNNLLAGQGLEAKMRLVIELRADTVNPYLRHFCIVKGNYLGSDRKNESYELQFDENTLLFTNTGERTPFEFLSKGDNMEEDRNKYDQIVAYFSEGKLNNEVAKLMGIQPPGFSKWLTKYENKYGWERPKAKEKVIPLFQPVDELTQKESTQEEDIHEELDDEWDIDFS